MLWQLQLVGNFDVARPHLPLPQFIQHRLEVVEENGIRQALEYKGELPERIDPAHIKDRSD